MANNSKDAAELVTSQAGKIHARVIDYKYGLQDISGVCAVRVIDNSYRLLIMEDYLPALGEVEGEVVIITHDQELRFQDISGFYKVQHNEFVLLIDGDMPKKAEAKEEQPV